MHSRDGGTPGRYLGELLDQDIRSHRDGRPMGTKTEPRHVKTERDLRLREEVCTDYFGSNLLSGGYLHVLEASDPSSYVQRASPVIKGATA